MSSSRTAYARKGRALSSAQAGAGPSSPRRRWLSRLALAAGFMALVVGAFVGALGGGASLAGANEIPVECLDYQAAMKRCYGESAERMRMPWQGANRALDMKGLGKQCGAETVRVNEACR